MLIDPVQPALVGQTGDEVQLGAIILSDRAIAIVIGLPIDEAEQHDDKDREHTGHRQRPLKSIRTDDVSLSIGAAPADFLLNVCGGSTLASHLIVMVRCENSRPRTDIVMWGRQQDT